jgi:hypothetical protein
MYISLDTHLAKDAAIKVGQPHGETTGENVTITVGVNVYLRISRAEAKVGVA